MPITLENLDQIFVYHEWTPEQVEKGRAIRAAAKELARIQLVEMDAVKAFRDAVAASGPSRASGDATDLQKYAVKCRNLVLDHLEARPLGASQENLAGINQLVMIANSAITFEAAALEPSEPAQEASVAVKATIPADASAAEVAEILAPVVSALTAPEAKDERPQVTD